MGERRFAGKTYKASFHAVDHLRKEISRPAKDDVSNAFGLFRTTEIPAAPAFARLAQLMRDWPGPVCFFLETNPPESSVPDVGRNPLTTSIGLIRSAASWVDDGNNTVYVPTAWNSAKLAVPHRERCLGDSRLLLLVDLSNPAVAYNATRHANEFVRAERLVVAGNREEIDRFISQARIDPKMVRFFTTIPSYPELQTRFARTPAPFLDRADMRRVVEWMRSQSANTIDRARDYAFEKQLLDGQDPKEVYRIITGEEFPVRNPMPDPSTHRYFAILRVVAARGIWPHKGLSEELVRIIWDLAGGAAGQSPPFREDLFSRAPLEETVDADTIEKELFAIAQKERTPALARDLGTLWLFRGLATRSPADVQYALGLLAHGSEPQPVENALDWTESLARYLANVILALAERDPPGIGFDEARNRLSLLRASLDRIAVDWPSGTSPDDVVAGVVSRWLLSEASNPGPRLLSLWQRSEIQQYLQEAVRQSLSKELSVNYLAVILWATAKAMNLPTRLPPQAQWVLTPDFQTPLLGSLNGRGDAVRWLSKIIGAPALPRRVPRGTFHWLERMAWAAQQLRQTSLDIKPTVLIEVFRKGVAQATVADLRQKDVALETAHTLSGATLASVLEKEPNEFLYIAQSLLHYATWIDSELARSWGEEFQESFLRLIERTKSEQALFDKENIAWMLHNLLAANVKIDHLVSRITTLPTVTLVRDEFPYVLNELERGAPQLKPVQAILERPDVFEAMQEWLPRLHPAFFDDLLLQFAVRQRTWFLDRYRDSDPFRKAMAAARMPSYGPGPRHLLSKILFETSSTSRRQGQDDFASRNPLLTFASEQPTNHQVTKLATFGAKTPARIIGCEGKALLLWEFGVRSERRAWAESRGLRFDDFFREFATCAKDIPWLPINVVRVVLKEYGSTAALRNKLDAMLDAPRGQWKNDEGVAIVLGQPARQLSLSRPLPPEENVEGPLNYRLQHDKALALALRSGALEGRIEDSWASFWLPEGHAGDATVATRFDSLLTRLRDATELTLDEWVTGEEGDDDLKALLVKHGAVRWFPQEERPKTKQEAPRWTPRFSLAPVTHARSI